MFAKIEAIRMGAGYESHAMTFDIDAYKRMAAPVQYDDLDYHAFATRPLSGGALRCLRYMCATSRATPSATCGICWSPRRTPIRR